MLLDEATLLQEIHQVPSKEEPLDLEAIAEVLTEDSEYEEEDEEGQLVQDLTAALELLEEFQGLMFLLPSSEQLKRIMPYKDYWELIKFEKKVQQFTDQWKGKE